MDEQQKQKRREYQRQYYLKNREKLLERHKQWGKDNREVKSEHKRQERARKNAPTTGGEVLEVLDQLIAEE